MDRQRSQYGGGGGGGAVRRRRQASRGGSDQRRPLSGEVERYQRTRGGRRRSEGHAGWGSWRSATVRTHSQPGSPQRTRGGVSGFSQPIGRQGTGKRTVVFTRVGVGRKLVATSMRIEGTKGKWGSSSVSVVAPLLSPGGADAHALYTRVAAPEASQSMRFLVATPVGTRRPKNKAWLSKQSMGGRAH